MSAGAAPESIPASLVFGLGSCQYPAGMFDATTANRSLVALEQLPLPGGRGGMASCKLDLFVVPGDRIYADATAGLFDPARLDQTLADAYEALRHSPGAAAVARNARYVLGLPDDHEIVDNWEPLPDSAGAARVQANQARRDEAIATYFENATAREKQARQTGTALQPKVWYAYSMEDVGGHEFFFADTRSNRTLRNSSTLSTASILGAEQWGALDAWLDHADLRQGLSFVVSPSMVLPRRLATARGGQTLRSDAWDGYPASLHALLAAVYRRRSGRIVFLSGDEHVSCIARIRIREKGSDEVVTTHSVHSSALNAPFPFANGYAEEFARVEDFADFGFEWPDADGRVVQYECEVRSQFAPGDGFAVLSAEYLDGAPAIAGVADASSASPRPPARGVRLDVDFYRPGALDALRQERHARAQVARRYRTIDAPVLTPAHTFRVELPA